MAVISLKNKLKSGSLLVGNTAYDPTEFDSIATVTVGAGGSATITFSSIPSTYKHLQIRAIARDARAISGANPCDMSFNSDTTYTNYRQHYLGGDGSAPYAGTVQASGRYAAFGQSAGASNSANIFAASIVDILDYKDTNKYQTVRVLDGLDVNGTGGQVDLQSSLWLSTSAITQIDITPRSSTGFSQYSHFALYGIGG